jgi:hypothetical protein
MSEDAGAAAGTAEGAQPTETPAAPAAAAQPAAPSPGVADRSAEQMLADAASSGAEDGDGGGEDPAKQIADLQRKLADARKHQRTWEGRSKANQDAADKLAQLEDANKTEVQRAADRAAAAEDRATKAEQLYHRTIAAARYELPPELIEYVSGGTEDEVNTSAEALASAINTRVAEQVAAQIATLTAAAANGGAHQGRPQRPVESLRPGALPAAQAAATDGSAWIRQALDARR